MSSRSRTVLVMATLLTGCASLPPLPEHEPVAAFATSGETGLGALAASASEPQAGRSGFIVQDTGRDAFLQRAWLIEAAERSIDAQYYIWNSDRSGRYLACRLYAAAERGVRVRLILDDINILGRDAVFAGINQHPNIEIRIFNPSGTRGGPGKWLAFVAEFERLNRRMHNKSFIADGAFGIVGGRNIGDEYFDLHPKVNFRDRDVLAVGPIVARISAKFDAYWNTKLSYPVSVLSPAKVNAANAGAKIRQGCVAAEQALGLPERPTAHATEARTSVAESLAALTWAHAELVFDPPPTGREHGSDEPQQTALALRALVDASVEEIMIESAYLILDNEHLKRLAELRANGVRVTAVTNSLASNDLTTNHSGYARRRKAMLTAGVELHELRPDAESCVAWIRGRDDCGATAVSLHSKSVVFDRRIVYIGSFNINLRSIYLNSETLLLIHSPELAQRVAADIELAMTPANSWRVSKSPNGAVTWTGRGRERWTHEPATGYWHRVRAALFRLVPMEKYL